MSPLPCIFAPGESEKERNGLPLQISTWRLLLFRALNTDFKLPPLSNMLSVSQNEKEGADFGPTTMSFFPHVA